MFLHHGPRHLGGLFLLPPSAPRACLLSLASWKLVSCFVCLGDWVLGRVRHCEVWAMGSVSRERPG